MVLKTTLAFLSLIAATTASPARLEERLAPSAVCAAVNSVVKVLSAQDNATPWCSSFLGIKTSTVSSATTVTHTNVVNTATTTATTSFT